MSYRSIKHVLGETSLERKCRLLFGVCLFFLIAGSFWLVNSRTEDSIYATRRKTGRDLVDSAMLQRHWARESFKNMKDSSPESTKKWIEEVTKAVQIHQDYSFRVLVPKDSRFVTANAWNLAETPFETQLLDHFAREPAAESTAAAAPEFVELFDRDKQEYRYFEPVRAREDCIKCHMVFSPHSVLGVAGIPSPPPPTSGELAAVVEIVMPDAETQTALNKNRAILLATAIVTMFLAMIAAYAIVRYVIVKPLKHLRAVSDEVSRGNIEARAEIHTADEFENLGAAFNKMLRHLSTAQEELRTLNSHLDTKVDELAQANLRLYELNRLKSDFLATMSHELRTPLNSILGFSDVLGSINALDDRQKRYVQNIQKSGRVLLEMINDILDLAKIESGKMELRLADFHIEDAIGAQCDMARPLSERKNIDLDIEVEPDLPELFQDQGKVQQILNNLLSNAIKFTPEGGRIVVSARRETQADGEQLVISVADTGVGIAEEDRVTIFEKFRQGKASVAADAMTREHSGTGLGLSIVKELCKLLGGEVTVASELGNGSTFTVRLPWVRADQPRMDSPMAENIDELLRPRRQELQRSLDRPLPTAEAR